MSLSWEPRRAASGRAGRRELRASLLAIVLAIVGVAAIQLPFALASTTDPYTRHANSAFGTLMNTYWNATSQTFYARSDHKAPAGGSVRSTMWWVAELWETVMDDYDRTGSTWDRSLIDQVYNVFVAAYGGFGSNFNDDRGWWALAATRAYSLTHESRFLTTAAQIAMDEWHYWDTTLGGGIWWQVSTHDQKNVATNAPAAMLNAALYRLTGLDKYRSRAIAIFGWVDSHLRSGGRLDDRIEMPNNRIQVDYSYNYGTYIGAALALFGMTKSGTYLSRATSLADSAMTRLTSNGILRDEGSGDGGGFKGIFVRNFRALAAALAVSADRRTAYTSFLGNNANVAWNHRITIRLWGTNWAKYATPPVESLTDMSAVDLFEAVALTH